MNQDKLELAEILRVASELAKERDLIYVVCETEKSYRRYECASLAYHSAIDRNKRPKIKYIIYPDSAINNHMVYDGD